MSTNSLTEVQNEPTVDVPTNGAESRELFEGGSLGATATKLAEQGLEPLLEGGEMPEEVDVDDLVEVSSGEGADEASEASTVLLPAYLGSYDQDDSAGNASSEKAAEVVIGRDDRRRITNTAAYPWRAVCSLLIRTKTGKTFIGTGWFIGPRTVMTAGHCVYMHKEGGWAKSITVTPGRNAGAKPYGSVTSSSFRSVTGWTTNGPNHEYDYGCITLPANQRLGARTGWFGFAYMGDRSLKGKYLNSMGYPGDKPYGTMWYHHSRVKRLTSRKVYYTIDTAGGQSGSPVYYIKDGKRYAVGIHAYGSQSGNSATRINKGVFNLMKRWKNLAQ
ncbi:MAG: serine protease [Bacteroidota bacterium]